MFKTYKKYKGKHQHNHFKSNKSKTKAHFENKPYSNKFKTTTANDAKAMLPGAVELEAAAEDMTATMDSALAAVLPCSIVVKGATLNAEPGGSGTRHGRWS